MLGRPHSLVLSKQQVLAQGVNSSAGCQPAEDLPGEHKTERKKEGAGSYDSRHKQIQQPVIRTVCQ